MYSPEYRTLPTWGSSRVFRAIQHLRPRALGQSHLVLPRNNDALKSRETNLQTPADCTNPFRPATSWSPDFDLSLAEPFVDRRGNCLHDLPLDFACRFSGHVDVYLRAVVVRDFTRRGCSAAGDETLNPIA